MQKSEKLTGILKALLSAYIITGVLLLLLALAVYKLELKEKTVFIGIRGIYLLSTFVGGWIAGKITGVRQFVWGIITGGTYFILLFLITLGIYHTFQESVTDVLVAMLLCCAGGMAGGMIS